jgi:hypothetical protein
VWSLEEKRRRGVARRARGARRAAAVESESVARESVLLRLLKEREQVDDSNRQRNTNIINLDL